MGAQITVNKLTTPLEDWFNFDQKLQIADFDPLINHHIGGWKLFSDDINKQQINVLPLQIHPTNMHNLFSPQYTYVLYAIKNQRQNISKTTNTSLLVSLLNSIQQNILEQSYRIAIVRGSIKYYYYYTYAFFGKYSKNQLKLAALSYAYKIQNMLNSQKKLAIFSGGMLRTNKLQKGSNIPLMTEHGTFSRNLSQFCAINLVNIFVSGAESWSIFQYAPKKSIPYIKCSITKNANKIQGIKPPMLKLALKPYQEVTYDQIADQQQNGIKFDIRVTTRHELKKQKFQNECSQVMEGLYVSGEKVAKNKLILQKHKIEAIINCAGDYCQNWFENQEITYLTFFLKDSSNENIQCLFYRVIQFIQSCLASKKNILIHCIQGISRSVTLVLAYIIFKLGYDYKKAEIFIKEKRAIACPNNGFMVQLIQFHKRLYENFDSLIFPRVFLVSSHCQQTPNILTARMLKQPLFEAKKQICLDSRGVYIIQTDELVYIWVGKKCDGVRLQYYWEYTQNFLKKLQNYERAPMKVKAISEGSQSRQFLSLWNLQTTPLSYQNEDYNRLFVEYREENKIIAGHLRKFYERQDDQVLQHNKLFIYPDYENGFGVYELDDLDGLCILMHNDDENHYIYIWKDETWNQNEKILIFLDNIMNTHYPQMDKDKCIIKHENFNNPSEEFISQF